MNNRTQKQTQPIQLLIVKMVGENSIIACFFNYKFSLCQEEIGTRTPAGMYALVCKSDCFYLFGIAVIQGLCI